MITMKPGDVIIFEAGDSWLSKCIAKLTYGIQEII